MPSGHAQITTFALVYSYLLSGQRLYESIALFAITILQRYVYKNHTLAQLFAGSLLGLLTAYGTIYVLNKVENSPTLTTNTI
jgi:hypothetical protein